MSSARHTAFGPRTENIAGRRFGRFVAIEFVGYAKDKHAIWLFRCDCGNERRTTVRCLKRAICYSPQFLGQQTIANNSCGCGPRKMKHGHSAGGRTTREYRTWRGVLARCLNPKNPWYYRYGGRGITVAEEWLYSFVNFLRDVGPCPSPHHSLDRINNDEGYNKQNVRWATLEQQANNRRDNVLICVNGITETLAETARRYGIPDWDVRRRLELGLLGDAVAEAAE
jgi:hypothetical protein